MELKVYQQRVVEEVRTFLDTLTEEQRGGNPKYASTEAWDRLRQPLRLSGTYTRQATGIGVDLPTICIKVPTGGGKTLLATQIIGQAYRSLLTSRNGAGLILWVVPSDQIYKDTLKALKNRRHPYREALEYALSRRVEVWEKRDIVRLTPALLATTLNVLIVKLQGTNRQDRESLKFFQDSGGNIAQHFPPEDEPDTHRELKERIPNLDMLADDAETGTYLAKTSIGNLVRLCEPLVILDEGHKATSDLAQETIQGFNPRLVVELSATPHSGANVLCRVSGTELLNEQMIKLPINVASSRVTSWQQCVNLARDKRIALANLAMEYFGEGNRLIRPIVLVQVERTGKDQRDTEFIHSEDVREYLVGHLGVPAECVAVKSSDRDDIEGIDLLDDACPIEWIITKAALQEGWDCPFAYILVSLSNVKSQQNMTQLVGRVLRQPFVEKTPYTALNESYVYCLRQSSESVIHEIRQALTKEGYEGSFSSVVDRSGTQADALSHRDVQMRPHFQDIYKEFEGKIYLPRFCVRDDSGEEALDYYRHLLSHVEITKFGYDEVKEWDFAPEFREATEQFRRVNLNADALEPLEVRQSVVVEDDTHTRLWLVANSGVDWMSSKQMRFVVDRVCERLQGVEGKLSLVRFRLMERIAGFIERETEYQTRVAFEQMYAGGKLFFGLTCLECRYVLPPTVERRRVKALRRRDDTDLQKSLFEFEPEESYNEFERSVALYLDDHPQVLWWYRNLVGTNEFKIEGWKRSPLYPDFVMQQGIGGKIEPLVWVLEGKGTHLKGNADTEYKREIARFFEKVGKQVSWQDLGADFDEHCFRFQVLDQGDYGDRDWRTGLEQLIQGALQE